MARIILTDAVKIEKEKNAVHEPVETSYSVFEKDGKRYIQFDTYGRKGRKYPSKISQSFQLDRKEAGMMSALLEKEFHLP